MRPPAMSLKEAMERVVRRAQEGPAIEEPRMDIGEAMRIVMRRHAECCKEERCPLK